MSNALFSEDDVISTYTIDQATEDGVLFDLRKVNPQWEKGMFSHITVSLFYSGYRNDDETVNIPNLLDLLNQSLAIVREKSDNFTKADWFFDGTIELPSGASQKVYIVQNETSKFTIMLPSDY